MQNLLMKLEENLTSDLVNDIVKYLKLFISILFLAHWMACLFYLIGREDSSNYSNSWISMTGVIDLDLYDKYIVTLYWAFTTMTTVGYGEIHPYTTNEKITVMCCMFVSNIMFAYIVGAVGDTVQRSNELSEKLRSQMISIERLLIHKRIPQEMRIKVRRYLEYMMEEKKKAVVDEGEIMNLLSVPLRDELLIYFHGSVMQSFTLFDDFTVDFLSYLTFFMRNEQFSVNDSIFEVFF